MPEKRLRTGSTQRDLRGRRRLRSSGHVAGETRAKQRNRGGTVGADRSLLTFNGRYRVKDLLRRSTASIKLYQNTHFVQPWRVHSLTCPVKCTQRTGAHQHLTRASRGALKVHWPLLHVVNLSKTSRHRAAMVAEAPCNLTGPHPPSQVVDNLPRYAMPR